MTKVNSEQQREIRSAYREIYQDFAEKTGELFRMYEGKIPGLEERVRNPAYDINGDNGGSEYLYDFPSFYQVEGVQFLMDQKRVLIADEMGGGKTAQAIAGKIALDNKLGRKVKTLIVSPNRQVKRMWAEKLKEYITPEQYATIRIENIESYKKANIDEADVVLIDYHVFSFSDNKSNNLSRKELKRKLMNAGFNYFVLDEAHNVKNFSSASRFNHVNDLASQSEYLCLLSGTPIPNSIQDIYALIALLKPEHIDESGKKVGYKNASAVAAEHYKTPSVVGAILRASRLERKLENVANLPSKTEECVHIERLSDAQQELYDSIYEDDSLSGLQKIQKLKQALLNPAIIDKNLTSVPQAKYEKLDEIVRRTLKKGEKIIIYSPNFRIGVVDTLRERYEEFGAVHMDGSNTSSRSFVIKRFQKDASTKIMIMNKVGGEGIPLTAANNLVFLEDPYSPGERRQVIGRIWRPGQKKPVTILTLNVDCTIDDGLRKFLEQKRIAIEYIEKGLPLTSEQRKLLSGDNDKALALWLRINQNYLYTPAQITGSLIRNIKEKPEEKVVKIFEGRFGKHLAESLTKSWGDSVLSNCANLYTTIINGIEKKEGNLEKIVDIASGFGALSHALQRRGIVNIDADKHHFNSPYASKENINLIGKMTKLPIEENGTFNLALCSMALDILPNTSEEPGRVKAVGEANRVLQRGGYYMFVLSAPAVKNDDKMREGMKKIGFEVLPELTGFVKSKDRRIKTNLYVLTAQKTFDLDNSQNVADFREYFELNSPAVARILGTAQKRRGDAVEFEFVRETEIEDLQKAIRRFQERKGKSNFSSSQV
ncbi:DEAD/DEAH box helicase family protein [Candidatus Pacearchaeota archaeon]|nr:DEAD/DEAH box helicase family protein [Candidatus Pacearchaeota archaeon]